MTSYDKPLPPISPTNQPYWDAAKNQQELHLQKCRRCKQIWVPAGPICPNCHARDFDWTQMSGRGTVNSWVVFHQKYYSGFEKDLPYNVCEVELDEGPRLMSSLTNVNNEDIFLGMPVEVVFEEITEEITLPKFQPAR